MNWRTSPGAKLTEHIKLSVVVPFLNAERTLTRCLESVISQTYIQWETILIDDGSSDNSSGICSKILDDNRFKLYKNPVNLGVSISRNIGTKIAKGQYIVVLDADDEMTPNRLADTLSILEKYPNIGLLAGKALQPNSAAAENYECPTMHDKTFEVKKTALVFGCPFVHSSIAYRRELFYAPYHLSYNPSLIVAHDYDLYLQISNTNFLMASTEKAFCVRHETGTGLMNKMSSRMVEETLRVKKKTISIVPP